MDPREMLSIIVPAYNEEEILASAMDELLADLERTGLVFEVIIAENGSTDSTAQLAEDLAGVEPRLRAIHLEEPDYGRAMRQGFLTGTGEYLVNFSVDFVDIAFLQEALVRLGGCDLVLGSKYVATNQDQRPATRRVCGRLLSWFVRMLFHLPVEDTHGLLVMRRESVLPMLEACRFGHEVFDTELITRAHRSGLLMCELPVSVAEVRPNRLGVLGRTLRMVTQLTWLRLALWGEGSD